MAILINFFDNVILQAISEEIVPKVSFQGSLFPHRGR